MCVTIQTLCILFGTFSCRVFSRHTVHVRFSSELSCFGGSIKKKVVLEVAWENWSKKESRALLEFFGASSVGAWKWIELGLKIFPKITHKTHQHEAKISFTSSEIKNSILPFILINHSSSLSTYERWKRDEIKLSSTRESLSRDKVWQKAKAKNASTVACTADDAEDEH